MRIITPVGFFATGASAVIDLLSEFDGVKSYGWGEHRFIQDPDGIADLEYNIIENNHRHNTSHAIKRYIQLAKSFKSIGYGKGLYLYTNDFYKYTKEYISEITELKARSWWFRDNIDKGTLYNIIVRGYSFSRKVLARTMHKVDTLYPSLSKLEYGYFSAISEEQFLNATRKYIDNVVGAANKENKEYILLEQLVPATNCNRYVRYFNDVKIIVMERDPRDVYLWEKEVIKWGVVPTKTVQEYVKWFKITRKYSHPTDEDPSKVLRIRFEDLIYNYDESRAKIAEFVGLSLNLHTKPFSRFVPEISIKNTNLASRIKGYEEDIKYIEKELPDYLFDFDSYKNYNPRVLRKKFLH